ncbi:sensor histidine kinase, partial [Lysobacter sp. 2RAB21]
QLRPPLAGLSLHADRARTSANEKDRSAALAQVQILTMRVGRIASQLLALTRAQAPADPVARMQPLRLDRLLPDILAGHVDRAMHGDIELGSDAPPVAVTIRADRSALHDAIDHLL